MSNSQQNMMDQLLAEVGGQDLPDYKSQYYPDWYQESYPVMTAYQKYLPEAAGIPYGMVPDYGWNMISRYLSAVPGGYYASQSASMQSFLDSAKPIFGARGTPEALYRPNYYMDQSSQAFYNYQQGSAIPYEGLQAGKLATFLSKVGPVDDLLQESGLGFVGGIRAYALAPLTYAMDVLAGSAEAGGVRGLVSAYGASAAYNMIQGRQTLYPFQAPDVGTQAGQFAQWGIGVETSGAGFGAIKAAIAGQGIADAAISSLTGGMAAGGAALGALGLAGGVGFGLQIQGAYGMAQEAAFVTNMAQGGMFSQLMTNPQLQQQQAESWGINAAGVIAGTQLAGAASAASLAYGGATAFAASEGAAALAATAGATAAEIGVEAGVGALLAPETLGLSALVAGGLIVGTYLYGAYLDSQIPKTPQGVIEQNLKQLQINERNTIALNSVLKDIEKGTYTGAAGIFNYDQGQREWTLTNAAGEVNTVKTSPFTVDANLVNARSSYAYDPNATRYGLPLSVYNVLPAYEKDKLRETSSGLGYHEPTGGAALAGKPGGGATSTSQRGQGHMTKDGWVYAQHGVEQVTTEPTQIITSEYGQPEKVSIQPISYKNQPQGMDYRMPLESYGTDLSNSRISPSPMGMVIENPARKIEGSAAAQMMPMIQKQVKDAVFWLKESGQIMGNPDDWDFGQKAGIVDAIWNPLSLAIYDASRR